MRLMSVALTEAQVRARTKTVTRRLGWRTLTPCTRLQLVRKAMGRKRRDGTVEPLVRLAVVDVTSVRRERLDAITAGDVAREGFPDWTPAEFVEFFCQSMRCTPDTEVARIEFRYVEVEYVRLLAGEVFKPEGVDLWMVSPNRMLNNATPEQFIAAGDVDRVLDLIDALASGAFV